MIFTLSHSLLKSSAFAVRSQFSTFDSVKSSIPDNNSDGTVIRSSSVWFIVGAVIVVVIVAIVIAAYLVRLSSHRHSHHSSATATEAGAAITTFDEFNTSASGIVSMYAMTLDADDAFQLAELHPDSLWDTKIE
jgi:hypothetical protein